MKEVIFINGSYYPNPTFPSATKNYEAPQEYIVPEQTRAEEESYIENIIRLNRGRKVNVFAAFPDANDWRDKVFSGIIEQSGRDHVIIRDVEKESWYLIPMIYVNFVEANEKFNYSENFSN